MSSIPRDARLLAREEFRRDPTTSQGLIGSMIGVPQQRVSEWIKDLKAKQDQKREWSIEILRRLGLDTSGDWRRDGAQSPEDFRPNVRNTGNGKAD